MSVAGRENISPIILAHTVTIWICTRLLRVIATENSTACEGYKSTRRASANNVIILPENVNRMMGLWIRITPTVFTIPLLNVSVLETFLASQEFSGPRVISELPGKLRPGAFFLLTTHLEGPIDQQITSFSRIIYDVCLKCFCEVTQKKRWNWRKTNRIDDGYRRDFNMNAMHGEPPFPCDCAKSRNGCYDINGRK